MRLLPHADIVTYSLPSDSWVDEHGKMKDTADSTMPTATIGVDSKAVRVLFNIKEFVNLNSTRL